MSLPQMLSAIQPRFDERKTAAAAAVILREAGGSMEYIKLIKLLYIADRESWLRFNRPITGDSYVAMRFGPVLSRTLDLIKLEPAGAWSETIERDQYHVRLKGSPDFGPLSDAEIEILRKAYHLFKRVDKWKLCDLTHNLPEWKDPGRSSTPIWPEDILTALEKTPEEIEEARQFAVEDAYLDTIFNADSR